MRSRVFLALALIAIVAVSVGMDYLYWKGADFSRMTPKSAGTAEERWFLTGVMLKGPLAWAGSRVTLKDDYLPLIWSTIMVACVALGIWKPRSPVFVVLALFGVIAWLCVGSARAALRIA
jgi:hypothetical protein